MMCDLIAVRARHMVRQLVENPSPWHTDYLHKIVTFQRVRRFIGSKGLPYSQFPWFDDNAAAVLQPLTSAFRKIRYDTWAEFHWDVSLPKAAINYWHDADVIEPTVGFEVVARQRSYWLPQRKVDICCADIDALLAAAVHHPQELKVHR